MCRPVSQQFCRLYVVAGQLPLAILVFATIAVVFWMEVLPKICFFVRAIWVCRELLFLVWIACVSGYGFVTRSRCQVVHVFDRDKQKLLAGTAWLMNCVNGEHRSMSKHETPMIEWYWRQVGGILIEEFPAVLRAPGTGQRLIDAIIVRDDEPRRVKFREVEIAGRDIIVVQAKRGRLGMYLMGQAFFSPQLMMKFNPRTITSITLCKLHDLVMVPLFESYASLKVIIYLRCRAPTRSGRIVIAEQATVLKNHPMDRIIFFGRRALAKIPNVLANTSSVNS